MSEYTSGAGLAPFGGPGDTPRPVSQGGEGHSGQVRMAYRLAASCRDELLHVCGIGWMYWDGRRWAEDRTGHAGRAVLKVLADALAESITDKTLRADVARCESAAGYAGVLTIAADLIEFATAVEDLDANPWLLNCANGTLDLRTRDLRPHEPADRLTRVTTGAYDPSRPRTRGRRSWPRFCLMMTNGHTYAASSVRHCTAGSPSTCCPS